MTKMNKAEILRGAAEYARQHAEDLSRRADRLDREAKVDRIAAAAKLAQEVFCDDVHGGTYLAVARALEAHFAQTAPAEPITQSYKFDIEAMVTRFLSWRDDDGSYGWGWDIDRIRAMLEHVLAAPAKRWTDDECEGIGQAMSAGMGLGLKRARDWHGLGQLAVKLVTGVTE